MKKIMFNDKYGLTQAVLKGRKTQTRRILNPAMLFERLGTYEGWAKESIADWKESCKARLYKAEGEELQKMLDYALEHSPYKVGETIAIAQRYEDMAKDDDFSVFVAKMEYFWGTSYTRKDASIRCLSVQTLCLIIFASPTSV